jgi:enamine deaminase RidA (YjgF/YER057c/UK114 family)
MRILRAIVQVAAGPVFDIGQQGTVRNALAAQTVGDQTRRFVLQAVQQALEEALGGRPISLLLRQDVQHHPVLIRSTPKVVQHASDAIEHLIEVPGVPRPRSTAALPFGKVGAKLSAPVSDAFVANHYTALGQDQFNLTQAEAETVIQPDCMLDDVGRKAKAAVGTGRGRHPSRMPRRPGSAHLTTPWQCRRIKSSSQHTPSSTETSGRSVVASMLAAIGVLEPKRSEPADRKTSTQQGVIRLSTRTSSALTCSVSGQLCNPSVTQTREILR